MCRIISILFIVITFASCGGSETTTNTATSDSTIAESNINILKIGDITFEISKCSKEECENYPDEEKIDTNERRRILIDSSKVKRVGDSLIISTKRKRVVFVNFMDGMDGTEGREYHYLYFDEKHNVWVVQGLYWEFADAILVDNENGDTVNVFDLYSFSPDAKYIFGASNAEMNGYGQILEKINGHYQKIAEEVELNWIPEQVKWIDKKSILISTYPIDDKGREYIKLTMK